MSLFHSGFRVGRNTAVDDVVRWLHERGETVTADAVRRRFPGIAADDPTAPERCVSTTPGVTPGADDKGVTA